MRHGLQAARVVPDSVTVGSLVNAFEQGMQREKRLLLACGRLVEGGEREAVACPATALADSAERRSRWQQEAMWFFGQIGDDAALESCAGEKHWEMAIHLMEGPGGVLGVPSGLCRALLARMGLEPP
eukprot:TRINITY_DN23220_c0_g1_i1.p3 TRINITY_DN23220_c0_g1~~TRINITY_DN23220_c0_g1_i1.p3  ORF type:complete len:127 (-),score=29.96 TRINITY_DN23220_c0_g1_i1:614-994(-)